MGTSQAIFAVDQDQKWRQTRDRKWRQSRALSGSSFFACATGSCAISALVGPFDRKLQSHVTGSDPDRKYVLPVPGFPPRFFLSSSTVVTWLPDVTEDHLTSSEFPWVCACATGSCATPVVTESHVTPSEVSLGCSLRRPCPIFSMVTGTSHPRPVFSIVTGTSPGYLPLLFSYSVYIGCAVLLVC